MAYNYLSRVPLEDVYLLNINPKKTLPTDFIVTHIIVPPNSIRPTVPISAGKTNEDDLTIKLGEMLGFNDLIEKGIRDGMEPSK